MSFEVTHKRFNEILHLAKQQGHDDVVPESLF